VQDRLPVRRPSGQNARPVGDFVQAVHLPRPRFKRRLGGAEARDMRLLGLLVVLVAVGVLGARAVHPSSHGPGSAKAARQVVDGARQDLQAAQTEQQARLDQQLQKVDQP
jgi:hypothetical protein